MARGAIVLALALLSFGPGAGAEEMTISGSVRFGNPSPCEHDECGLFLASNCEEDAYVQKSTDDPKPTAGNFASVVAIPPEARGKIGLLEWKLTGDAATDSYRGPVFISDTCERMPGSSFHLGPGQQVIPQNAGWFVFYKHAFQMALLSSPIWWRWRLS